MPFTFSSRHLAVQGDVLHAGADGELLQALRDGSQLRMYSHNNQGKLTMVRSVELPNEAVPEALHARLHDVSIFLSGVNRSTSNSTQEGN
jgi:hypothetical protein